jgi:hypothetical protein
MGGRRRESGSFAADLAVRSQSLPPFNWARDGCAMGMSRNMSARMIELIDPARYPSRLGCMHCGGTAGHDEEVWTGDACYDDKSGFEVWFCCHACRDAVQPRETFFPIRLKTGSPA